MEQNNNNNLNWEIKCFNCRTRIKHNKEPNNRFKCSECNQYNKPRGKTLIEEELFSKKEVKKDE